MRSALVLFFSFLGCSSSSVPTDDAGNLDAQMMPKDSASDTKPPTDAGSDAAPLDGYYAFQRTNPNRLILFYADAKADLCFMVRLTERANMSALTLPNNWDVESNVAGGGGVFKSAAACSIFYSGQAEYMQALSMSGTVSWTGQALPKTIDSIDVTLNFMPNTWAPNSQDMKATNVSVK